MPPQNIPLWYTDYFILKVFEKQPMQGHFDSPLPPYPAESRRQRIQSQKAIQTFFTNLLTPLSCQFFTNLLYLCLVVIKDSCFGHFFEFYVFMGLSYYKICFSPVNLFHVNLIIITAKESREGKKGNLYSSILHSFPFLLNYSFQRYSKMFKPVVQLFQLKEFLGPYYILDMALSILWYFLCTS